MSQYFKDSLAICRAIGHPSLFLTMTCNSKWPEIQEMLKFFSNVDYVDAPFNGNTYFDDCGFPVYRMRNTGTVINKKGINLDNQYVVPYNRDLLLWFQCHINLEICISSRSLKYLFKYCLKGHDTAIILLKNKSNKLGSEQTARSVKNLDEVKIFLDGRYVCACEASWRIFGFDIHHRSPSVKRLPIHFPGQKYLNFQSSTDLENVCNNATSKKSKLEALFVANSEFLQARNFTYSDFPTHFTWIKKTAKWKLRQRGDVVGRCKGALSFTQLRTIDGTIYDTFREAYGALGLLNNDKQWHDALEENAFSAMPTQIRAMCKILDKIHLILSEYEIQNYALAEIEKLLYDVEGKIVLPVAGSGIAATLLPGGRTTHSRFKISLKLDQSSITGIKHCTYIAELMQHTSLIIWNEAPMQHRYAFEAVDRSL
ncbi:uncharacterized protein LOC141679588 [Apium graveolens]|uniref:uncharacterized protein LOC141679588 n=1 Tax=Apium graveolens TaxID=4045 RepID=UPI003D7AC601